VKVLFTEHAWQDYIWWQEGGTSKLKRINELIKDIQRSPFRGIGKPEPLKGDLSGYWSRRIDQEHRLVYRVHQGTIHLLQCRYHY
jgi:toxin YoeB